EERLVRSGAHRGPEGAQEMEPGQPGTLRQRAERERFPGMGVDVPQGLHRPALVRRPGPLQADRAGIRGEDAGEQAERGFLDGRRTRPGDGGNRRESGRRTERNPAEAGANAERGSGLLEEAPGVRERDADVAAAGFVGAGVRIALVAEEDRPGAERG